ncbi:MAG: type II toxin-antitoxin system prevent-host-death family antitoxin [Proteobacteria bacterium]|jgi:prevent-host-death family protein|nr:type II toxin-antitoxin system prevent-host-death family antitoxin [Pseudomonadota bacterium]
MIETTVSDLRKNLQRYLARVAHGEEVRITKRGQVIARVVGCADAATEAREELKALREVAVIGDITSPVAEEWSADAPL